MLKKIINNYVTLYRTALRMASHNKLLFSVFIVLSLLAALSEGIGVSMLVPILEVQSSKATFADTPVLKSLSSLFDGMSQHEKLRYVASILAGFIILRGVLLYLVEVLACLIPLKLEKTLIKRSYKALLDVEYTFISENDVGTLTNGLSGWANAVARLLTGLAGMIFNTALLLVYLVIMLMLSWKLALLAMVFFGVISGGIKSLLSKRLNRLGAELSKINARLSETIFESISGMKLIRTSVAEDFMRQTFTRRLSDRFEGQTNVIKLQRMVSPLLMTSSGLFVCALLLGGTYINDAMDEWLGGLLLFLFLSMRLLSPLSQINSARAQIMETLFSMDKLDSFFEETSKRAQPSGSQPYVKIKDGINFENVNFTYPLRDQSVINDLSLHIKAGEMVAVVGPSGSGKSTLVSLLTRFYDPQCGSIKIDGVDLTAFEIHDLRRNISVVSQDIFIFNDTVKNNIAFSLDGVSDEDIYRAAKLAAADEFICDLPQGYETKLGDRGLRLSGGQQQRIAIARAILRAPDLLIMDEATSNLDTFTEQAIQNAVEILRKDRTLIVIAHRLSTISRADRVFVIHDGQLVEQGSHEDLLANKGAYWDMVRHQNLDLVDKYDDPVSEEINRDNLK